MVVFSLDTDLPAWGLIPSPPSNLYPYIFPLVTTVIHFVVKCIIVYIKYSINVGRGRK